LSGPGTNEDANRRHTRFHGRVEGANRACSQPGCENVGEFRAPPEQRRNAPDGPPQWRWFCLDHIRAFNQQYNYFKDMSPEEIDEAQRPFGGWERETRAFSASAASGTMPPRWAEYADPLDAIGARFKARMAEMAERGDGKPLSGEDRSALKTLGLSLDADRKALRTRYTELVRRFHPDHNGGDRAHEKALQDVLAAYAHLRKAPAFA